MDVIIYHNPRCSKSRATLELLRDRGVEPLIIHYLDTPPAADRLAELAARLGLEARGMLRTGEPLWVSLGLDAATASPELLFQTMAEHPALIQRPIVVVGDRARIGRPPEAVLELFQARC
jgi:arsenate reductase